MNPLHNSEILVRLVAAVVSGAVLGWDREIRAKSAGLRTHMMVSLGAATILVIGIQITASLSTTKPILRVDPLRLIEAVMGGIGFLGAGSIIQSRGSVRGLTTAASVWLCAATGIACGFGDFMIAATSALLGLAILLFLKVVEDQTESDTPGSRAAERASDRTSD